MKIEEELELNKDGKPFDPITKLEVIDPYRKFIQYAMVPLEVLKIVAEERKGKHGAVIVCNHGVAIVYGILQMAAGGTNKNGLWVRTKKEGKKLIRYAYIRSADIAEHGNMSITSVQRHIKILERKQLIKTIRHGNRKIYLFLKRPGLKLRK